jgi:hypothetical protein
MENALKKLEPYKNLILTIPSNEREKQFPHPILTCDSSLHFEGIDFDPTHIKREALKSVGKTETDCTQAEIGKIMNDFYISLAKKNG